MAVLKQISTTCVPTAPKDSPSKNRPSSRASSARIGVNCRCYRRIFKCDEAIRDRRIEIRNLNWWFVEVTNHEKPGSKFDPGFLENFTPLVPFRWISRSLLVTG